MKHIPSALLWVGSSLENINVSKISKIIDEELSEMKKKGKDLYWTGRDDKDNLVTGKKSFARERDMNDDTYALRRQIINIIYEAKNLLNNKLNYEGKI